MDARAPDRKFALPSGVFFFLLLANLFHKAAHSGGCLVLLLPGGVGVGPQGKPCIEVAQHAGYGFHIYAVLQRRGCKSVPEIVEPDMLQSGVLQDLLM